MPIIRGWHMLKEQIVIRAIFKLILCIATSSTHVFAQEAEVIVSFEEWEVAKDDVACWISAEASFVADDDIRLPNAIMSVAFFYGNHNPEISFSTPGCCGVDVSAHTESYVMPLTFYEYTHFSQRNGELDFLLNLLKSSYVDIKTDVNDERIMSFSLAGFRDAYNEISRICEFRSLDLRGRGNSQAG
jgi:hypothetical protein